VIDDPEVARLRGEIDRIDQQLLELLQSRARLVLAVGDRKRARSLAVHDPERESDLLARLTERAGPPLDRALVEGVFREIVSECRRLEHHHVSSAQSDTL
jgi:chorismate mutase/prephenate dehydratase